MKKHHSVEDWDRNDPAVMVLEDMHYVSEPSSLSFIHVDGHTTEAVILSRDADAQNIPEGRIVCQFLGNMPNFLARFHFRNQSALGTATRDNCYLLTIIPTEWTLDRWIDGINIEIGVTPCTLPTEWWFPIRISWWNGYSEGGLPALAVMVERQIDEEWVKQGETLYDEDNHFKDSEINRCGHGCHLRDPNHVFVDDTEIWERAS